MFALKDKNGVLYIYLTFILVIFAQFNCNGLVIENQPLKTNTNEKAYKESSFLNATKVAENEAVVINLIDLAKQRAQLEKNEIYKLVEKVPKYNHSNNTDSEIIFDAEILIPYNTVTPVQITNLNESLRQQIEFGIVQLHVGFPNPVNLSLSYNRTLVPNFYQNGTNLGLIVYGDDSVNASKRSKDEKGQSDTVYIHNLLTSNDETVQLNANGGKNGTDGVSALIVFIIYYRNSSAPVPGGCNLEYSMMQEAPIMTIEQRNGYLIVDTPLAAASFDEQKNFALFLSNAPASNRCETNDTKYLQYETRYLYLPSTLDGYSVHDFFNYIRSMLTTAAAEKTGFLAKKQQIPLNRRTFITMPGSNIIFVTIVKAPRKLSMSLDGKQEIHIANDISSATYVPKMYSWSEYNDKENTEWYYDSGILSTCLAAALLVIGAIKCFINYKNTPIIFEVIFNFINIYITSLLIFTLIYLLFVKETNVSELSDLHLLNLSTIGPFAFVLSVLLFVCCGFAGGCTQTSAMDSAVTPIKEIFQQLAVQTAVCFFLTSLMLFFSSSNIYLTSTSSIQLYLFYWLCSTTFVMIVLPSLLSFYWNNLILNSLWGGFFIMTAMTILLKNPLRILCIYSIRFILDADEYRSGLTPPFGVEEYVLIGIGKILSVIGVIMQHKQKLNEDAIRRQHRFDRREVRSSTPKSLFSQPSDGSSTSIANERTALIKH